MGYGFDSIPEGMDVTDGNYRIEVELSGGSGRASVTSPTDMKVEDGVGTVLIEWSSPNYDYMIYQGEKLLPLNTEGNSCFELKISELDTAIPVIADTTAMSVPHEIEYTLSFKSSSLEAVSESTGINGSGLIVSAVLLILIFYSANRRIARRKYQKERWK